MKKETFGRLELVKEFADYVDGDIFFMRLMPDALTLPLEQETRIDSFTVVFCMEGEARFSLESKEYTFRKYDLMVLPPSSVIHGISYTENCQVGFLSLSNNLVRELLCNDREIWQRAFYLKQNPIIHLREEDQLRFREYGRIFIIKTRDKQNRFHKEIMRGLVQAILYELFAYLEPYAVQSNETQMMSQGDLLFRRFISILSENSHNERITSYYADKLCVTSKYLSNVCQKVSGRTATEWINLFMVERIRRMLRYSEKSVKEISDELDFPNISFFGKYVKQHLGMSPINYRKNLHVKEE